MTSPILLAVLGLTLTSAIFAQDAAEEALILNQELQFLEESIKPIQVSTLEGSNLPSKSRSGEKPSLEKIYFGDDSDSISSRTAAPKRKARKN